MKIGARVRHDVYGFGTIISIEHGKKLGDGSWPKLYQSSIVKLSNGASRYNGVLNVGIKFEKGGPIGWAKDASHNLNEIELVDDQYQLSIHPAIKELK